MNECLAVKERPSETEEAVPDPARPLPDLPAGDPADSVTDGVVLFCEAFLLFQKLLFNTTDLRNHRLTRSQIYVMLGLQRHSPMTMSQVAAGLAVSKEQATRTVASLVELGYVERLEDQSNRKLVLVRLTQQGKTFLEQEKERMKENLHQRLRLLNQSELTAFNQAVQTLIHSLEVMELG